MWYGKGLLLVSITLNPSFPWAIRAMLFLLWVLRYKFPLNPCPFNPSKAFFASASACSCVLTHPLSRIHPAFEPFGHAKFRVKTSVVVDISLWQTNIISLRYQQEIVSASKLLSELEEGSRILGLSPIFYRIRASSELTPVGYRCEDM